MSCDNFGDYVTKLGSNDDSLALAIRRFIKTERTSFHDLQSKARQTAHFLADSGVNFGDRIMVVADNSPEWIELFLGVQLIGAILVPVDAASSTQVLARFIKDTEPRMIFCSRGRHEEISSTITTYLLDEHSNLIEGYPQSPLNNPDGNATALIVYTSGTTAAPKGVMLTQRNVLSNIEGILDRITIDPEWRLLSVLPLSHMYELTGSLAALNSGAGIFYVNRVTPSAIVGALNDYRITTMLAIPQLLVLMLEQIEQAARRSGKAALFQVLVNMAGRVPFSLRRHLFAGVHKQLGGKLDLVVVGGAPVPEDIADAWEKMGVRIVEGYGLTETSPILTVNSLEDRHRNSPGRALFNVDIRIGEEGEIQVKGPNVFPGYWRNEQATREAFTSERWFRTGDVGELKEGFLHIRGRLKSAIVLSSGLKVFPEDIELISSKSPVLSPMCIVGETHADGERVLAVVASQRPEDEISQAIADVNAQLESFQHIASWRRWPDSDFPRTRLLKIDRRKVQEWANSVVREHVQPGPARTLEDPLSELIRESLGDRAASFHDENRLSDVGLDSLRRLTLVSLIEQRLGTTIPEEFVTQETTVEQLRAMVSQGRPFEAHPTLPEWPFNSVARAVGDLIRDQIMSRILRIWVEIRVEGAENVLQLSTPSIIIFNHTDDFDGPVVYKAIPVEMRRKLSVAAADDVMRDHKFLAFVIRLCFAGFNISRTEPYMPSMEYIGRLIDSGRSIVLSPEGSVSKSGELQPFKSGVGLLAVELGVPIVPLKTHGLKGTVPLHAKWPKKRSKVTVKIGEPVRFGPHDRYDEVAMKLHHIMETL